MYVFEPQRHVDNKQWVKGQPTPTVATRARSSNMRFVYIFFFISNGLVVQIPTPNGKNVMVDEVSGFLYMTTPRFTKARCPKKF